MSIDAMPDRLLDAVNEAMPGARVERNSEGTIEVSMTPRFRHQQILAKLNFLFTLVLGDAAQDQLLPGVGVDAGTAQRMPDLAVLRAGRVDDVPPDAVYIDPSLLALVVEVVSPSSSTIDSQAKRAEYASAGIPIYWVVTEDTVAVHILVKGKYLVTYLPFDQAKLLEYLGSLDFS